MGITIHYKGKIRKMNLIDELCDELIDIAKTMNWKSSDLIFDKEDKIKGVSIILHEKSESLDFFFNIDDGGLRNIMNVITKEAYNPNEPEWAFIKTQFAPPEVHATVVKLLKYIKKKYIPNLKVNDEGDYWETGDIKILKEKLKFLSNKIDLCAKTFESMPLKFDKILKKINIKGKEKEITIHRNKDSKLPQEFEDLFLKQMEAFENAPDTIHFAELLKRGVYMPEPEELNDEQLHEKLWEVINELAKMRVFLDNTNHLSDRELYSQLLKNTLQEWTQDLPPELEMNCHIDVCSSGIDDYKDVYYKYYADEEERKSWKNEEPDYEMPEHEDPAFDRDRFLPQAR